MKEIYACLFHQTGTDEEFQSRIPRLMIWLRELYAGGHLVGCGGGGWQNDTGGGLTLITADTPEEAERLSAGTPMNEIGYTEILQWGVFYANLNFTELEERLKG